MMTKQFLALILATAILTMTACSGTVSQQPDLNGTSWTLTSIQGKPVLSSTQPDLSFDNGQASGTGSCNGFGGSYTLSGNKLTFGPLMSTMMACNPPEVMDQEQAYFSALSATASYRVEGNRLTLLDVAGNVLAEFVAVK
jgi:heat shock protein HslJ